MADTSTTDTSTDEDHRHMTVMQRFWTRLANWLAHHAGLVAIIGLLITLALGAGMTRLSFSTGQDSYLNADDQVYIDNVQYQGLFGGDAMLVLLTAKNGKTANDLMSGSNQAEYDRFAAAMAARPDLVEGTITPKTAIEWSDKLVNSSDGNPVNSVAGKALVNAIGADPTDEGKAARTQDSAQTLQRLGAIPVDERTLSNPAWVDFLLHDNQANVRKALLAAFPDNNHAQIVVRLKGNGSIEQEGAGADLVKQGIADAKFTDADITVTGAPVLLKEINDYLRNGMFTLGGIAIVVMALILLVLFHVRWRLLPLAVIVVGVIWAFGLAGYIGIPLSLVTIAGLPVMLGVGIDYAIQMQARVEEEVLLRERGDPIQETARNLCPALLVVTFDAVFAFSALHFAKVPMIRQFGLLLAVGIAAICLCSIVVPLATLGIRENKWPTTKRGFKEGVLGKFVVKLGSLPKWMGPVLAVASLAVFFGGLAVEDKLVLQTDPIQWLDQQSQIIKDLRTVESQTGSSSELGIFIRSDDPFSQDTVTYTDQLAEANLAAHPEDLITATSVTTTMDDIISVPGAGHIVPTADSVKAAYDVAPPAIQHSTINPAGKATNLIFRYAPRSLEQRAVTLDEINASTKPPPGVTATPSGLAVVGVGLLRNLTSNRILLTYLAIIFVGLFLAVRLRSVVRSLLSLVPVLIAVGAASLIAWALSLKLSPLTAVGGPLVVAACTEFTSLILLRFIEERKRGYTPQEAVDITAGRTGRAFIVSGLTAIAGVAVISTSNLPLLRDFGIVVGLNVAIALLSALIVLPPLLVWADGKRCWVSRHMVDDETLVKSTPGYKGRANREAYESEPEPVG